MSKHITVSPTEAADRRDTDDQMSLFTEDTHFVVYMNEKDRRES